MALLRAMAKLRRGRPDVALRMADEAHFTKRRRRLTAPAAELGLCGAM